MWPHSWAMVIIPCGSDAFVLLVVDHGRHLCLQIWFSARHDARREHRVLVEIGQNPSGDEKKVEFGSFVIQLLNVGVACCTDGEFLASVALRLPYDPLDKLGDVLWQANVLVEA